MTKACAQLFGAHVSPAKAGTPTGVAWDEGGWDVYGYDWRHYFDCMLAPVARQAAGMRFVELPAICTVLTVDCEPGY